MSDGAIGAVDIGASKVLAGLASADGHLLPGRVTRFETPEHPAALADMVATAITGLGTDLGTDLGTVPSILSCAAPAPLDAETGVLLNLHNRHWARVPLAQLLNDRLKIPVVLEDDATAAAIGEALAGAGAGYDPVGYLTVSSGVGAGVVIGGRPLRGAHGLAGEIGHLVVDPAGPECGCGRRGDIESYAGGLCLARRAAELWPDPWLPDGTVSPRSAQDVFDLASRGNQQAISVTETARHAVARAIATIAAMIDPGRIVIGGAIVLAQPEWAAAIASDARALCMAETGSTLEVVPAMLQDQSALAGAALLGAAQIPATHQAAKP